MTIPRRRLRVQQRAAADDSRVKWVHKPPVVVSSMQWTTNYEYTEPSGAASVSVTPSAVSWAYSSWVQVLASASAASALSAIHIETPGIDGEFEVEIGVGAAAAEATITAIRGSYFAGVGSTPGMTMCRLPIPVDAIPSSGRVAVRMRKSGTSVTPWTFAISILQKPIVGDLQISTQPVLVAGAGAAAVAVPSSATAWTFGAWTTLIASTATDIVLVAVNPIAPSNSFDYEFEIGVGPAASEVTRMAFAGVVGGLQDGPCYVPLQNPVNGIPAGSRVAARMRKAQANTTGVPLALMYMAAPL